MPEPRKLSQMSGEDRVKAVLARTFLGLHHCQHSWDKRKPWGDGWRVVVQNGMATYDASTLTRLVIAAHDLRVRVEILGGAGPCYTAIALHPRRLRDSGSVWDRHPSIEYMTHWCRVEAKNLGQEVIDDGDKG